METKLYQPVKAFLKARGFSVKGEIGGCDILAISDDAPPIVIVCELKLSFTLSLVLQAADRARVADEVWLAVARTARGRERDRRVLRLCRHMGIGLLTVAANGLVELVVSPAAGAPRPDRKRRSRLVDEHRRRLGDPSPGGSTRVPLMTAYRQQALVCAHAMACAPRRPRDMKPFAPDAAKILGRDVYGWFERVERGLYRLTETGQLALRRWPDSAGACAPSEDATDLDSRSGDRISQRKAGKGLKKSSQLRDSPPIS